MITMTEMKKQVKESQATEHRYEEGELAAAWNCKNKH